MLLILSILGSTLFVPYDQYWGGQLDGELFYGNPLPIVFHGYELDANGTVLTANRHSIYTVQVGADSIQDGFFVAYIPWCFSF